MRRESAREYVGGKGEGNDGKREETNGDQARHFRSQNTPQCGASGDA